MYCSLIEACQGVFALSRAKEWTAALSRWCDQQKDMVAFQGSCLVRRTEIMRLEGAWLEALTEISRACERTDRPPPSAAFYHKAEMHRLRGEVEEAESAYRSASRSGREPQPGLALLRLSQGRTAAASAAIRRIVGATADPLELARVLPAHVEIMLATGDIEQARSASGKLEEIAQKFDTEVLQAMAAQARGAVALAEGDSRSALASLHHAFEMWQETEAPYEAARVRVLIGLACRSLGDEEAVALEIAAAREVFETLGAIPDLARLATLDDARTGLGAAERGADANTYAGSRAETAPPLRERGLTRRELQILRLIASGKTNKSIASELFLSERTIDRHVSNILCKLEVPSRAAATAYAYEHKLLQ
jgi:ATP/maltotriose-dependent transcriptional regulator MalT